MLTPGRWNLFARDSLWSLPIALALVGLSSCGGPKVPIATVRGQVIYKGTPYPGGYLNFQSDTGFGASAIIQRDGTFEFVSQHGKGLPLETYKVYLYVPDRHDIDPFHPEIREIVEATAAIKLPKKYFDARTSGLTANVVSGVNDFKFELESSGR